MRGKSSAENQSKIYTEINKWHLKPTLYYLEIGKRTPENKTKS